MVEARDIEGEMIVLRLNGAVSTHDVVTLFADLVRPDETPGCLRILLDWSGLDRWTLEDRSVLDEAPWSEAARSIERIAIVHRSTWKRQAALVAAILRRRNVAVRSWKPEQMREAIAWLSDAGAARADGIMPDVSSAGEGR